MLVPVRLNLSVELELYELTISVPAAHTSTLGPLSLDGVVASPPLYNALSMLPQTTVSGPMFPAPLL